MCLLPTVNCSSDSRCFTSSTDYQEHHALWWLEPVTGAHVVKGTNLNKPSSECNMKLKSNNNNRKCSSQKSTVTSTYIHFLL